VVGVIKNFWIYYLMKNARNYEWVWQHSHLSLYFFFKKLFLKKSNPKHSDFFFFFTFYIISIIFYYYSNNNNKKTLQNKTFSLFYKTIPNIFILYITLITSYYYSNKKFHNTTIYQTHPSVLSNNVDMTIWINSKFFILFL
jgi:hypothetical protein